jgi:probable rRNA maturation factor
MRINFINETKEDVKEYKKLIRDIFKFEKRKIFFNLIFVDKEKIQEINRDYRGIDRVTDVITFALNDDPSLLVFGNQDELGDVFLCLEKAYEQALDYGHSKEREIGFLAVHGYLHLKGYDHMNPEDEKVMFNKQDEILNNAKLFR